MTKRDVSRGNELDLSDIVLKSEYDASQQEATASASYMEKTTTIQQNTDSKSHPRVSINV